MIKNTECVEIKIDYQDSHSMGAKFLIWALFTCLCGQKALCVPWTKVTVIARVGGVFS